MPDCTNIQNAYDATVGAPVNPTNEAIHADTTQPNNKEAFKQTKQEAAREAVVDELEAENADANPSMETPSAGDKRSARATSRGVSKIIKAIAGEGLQKRYDDFVDAMQQAAGTTILQTTKWMNLQNWLYTNWVNERGAMHTFLRSVANIPGVQGFMNPLIRQFDQMFNKAQALLQTYNTQLTGVADSVSDIAKATGRKPGEVATRLGDWCNAHHIIEDNANGRLIDNWHRQADEMRENQKAVESEADRVKMQQEINRLEDQAAALEDALEDPAPETPVRSAGYTDAEARQLMADIERELNITPDRAKQFHAELIKVADGLILDRARAGGIENAVAESIPDFTAYSPLMSRRENMSGANNDIAIYSPGSYYSRQGRLDPPESAFVTLGFLAKRAANEQATRDFGLSMAALNRQRLKEIRDSIQAEAKGKDIDTRTLNAMAQKRLTEELGLKSVSYRQLLQQTRARDWQVRDRAMQLLNNNGIVIDVPVKAKDGTISLQRRYMWFDENFQLHNTKVTGRDLNTALTSNYKLNGLAEFITKVTSYAGQSNTRFQPLFAPVAGVRNIMETVFHMVNRDSYTESGKRIGGHTLIGKYLRNVPRAGEILAQGMLGKLDPNTPAGRLWEEFKRSGVHQEYTPGMLQRNTGLDSKMPEWLTENPHTIELQKYLGRIGDGGKVALRALDGMNNWFQSVAAFNQFMTLRESGVPVNRAAQDVLDLMNMSQTGKFSRYLRVVAPFVNPTVQSTAAFARTLGFGATTPAEILKAGGRGWGAMLGAGVCFSAITPMLRELMGTDENGHSYYDQLSTSQATSSLNIGTGDGGRIRIPIGYGPMRTAAVIGHVLDKVQRGLMDVPDAAYEVLFSTFKDTVPGNFPDYTPNKHPLQWAMALVVPEPLRPFLELSTNVNYFGNEITNATRTDKALADQGRTSTPAIWHQFAKRMTREGWPDLSPEQWQGLAKSLYIGPGKLLISYFTQVMEEGALRKNGNNKTALEEMGPFLSAMGGSLFYGKVRNPAQSIYYEIIDDYNERIKRAGINLTAPENKGKPEQARAYRLQQLEDSGAFTQDEIDDIMALRDAQNKINAQGKAFNAEYRDRWLSMEDSSELREAFLDLHEQNMAVINDTLEILNNRKARR